MESFLPEIAESAALTTTVSDPRFVAPGSINFLIDQAADALSEPDQFCRIRLECQGFKNITADLTRGVPKGTGLRVGGDVFEPVVEALEAEP